VVPDGVGWWWRWTSPGLLLNWSALGVRPPLRLVSRTAVPVPYGPSTTRHSRGHDRGTAGRSRVARRNIDRRGDKVTMASRRDELNAYNFARKRTVASFLKPLPNGSVESAPRPLRTVVPSMVLGMLILAGFGACGIIKPAAPKGWDNVGEKVIVGDKSTTRYVVLEGEKDR